MNRFVAASLLLFLCACATDNYQAPPPARGGGERSRMRTSGGGSGLEMMPPDEWWRDARIATAVGLSGEQVAKLDAIGSEQGEPIARLERDGMLVARDLRVALDATNPTADDIAAAGRRVRELRGTLFDRQVQMVASERLVLTQEQWRTLQAQILEERRPQRDEGYPGGRRGRGGMGGGGRRPFPG